MKNIVFTNGVFDLFHYGHLTALIYARQLAGPKGKLIVAVNSDESVRRLKGEKHPIIPERHRLEIVHSLGVVSSAFLFHEDDAGKYLEQFRPDIYFKVIKSPDEKVPEAEVAKKLGISTVLVLASTFSPEPELSTSKIIERIVSLYGQS